MSPNYEQSNTLYYFLGSMYLYLLDSLPPHPPKRYSGDHRHPESSDFHTEAVPALSTVHKPHFSAENMLHSSVQFTKEEESITVSCLLNILTKAQKLVPVPSI